MLFIFLKLQVKRIPVFVYDGVLKIGELILRNRERKLSQMMA